MENPQAGVSRELARSRAASLSDLRYELSFDIPAAADQPLQGQVTLTFMRQGEGPLVLDFDPVAGPAATEHVESVRVNGQASAFRLANGHLIIPAVPGRGRHRVSVAFRAGEGGLSRRDDYLYTLFVPALAHTVFPVLDQPDLKARYQLTLGLPSQWRAVANGALVERDPRGERVQLRFAETAPIPSYLFAFAAGDFQVEEARRNGRTLRMLHRETDAGKVARNRAAVFDLHGEALAWLEDYTGIPYPFDKFDFVLLPAFEFGGMEHPGAVFYRDERILLDASATQRQYLERASLISHETAHMWFGDLVTMPWFDDVWMKEVFANVMAAKLVNPGFPQINHELHFLTDHYPRAYGVDRTAGTHPVRQSLDNLNEAGGLYGAIIYQKAPIVMRQLELLLGQQAFRAGLRRYLDEHRYGNAGWTELIHILDAMTATDLRTWSEAWVEEAGRPVLRVEVAPDESGAGMVLVQEDPVPGRGLRWPQAIEVLAGSAAGVGSHALRIEAERTPLPALPREGFLLPSGGGLAYGDIVLDAGSRAWLLAHLGELEDALARGAAWVTLWEEMLNGRIGPRRLLDLALQVLPREADEQLVQLMLDGVREVYWRYLPAARREALSARVEGMVRAELEQAEGASLKAAWFGAYRALVTTPAGLAWLERVWAGDEEVPGLPLVETDRIRMAEALALRGHPRADAIIERQLERIDNPDRRARLQFLRPALSGSPAAREDFFRALLQPANRGREPWVEDGLAFLHHPLRAAEALHQLRPALDALEEIRATGDIFFPRNWLVALFTGHNSPAAAAMVRDFLAQREPDYPPRLRQLVLQAADPVFRAAAVLEQ